MLKPIDRVALVLVIVGALNWALVGLFEFDLVAALTGTEFGETNIVSRIIYLLVGIAGVWLLPVVARGLGTERGRETERAHEQHGAI
jgi:uncharacterized membrane protein YuzA (DUF378 family)